MKLPSQNSSIRPRRKTRSCRTKTTKPVKLLLFSFLLIALLTGNSACGLIHNLFGPKYGCPSDGKNVGAERILSGEKVPKSPKFKA
jgi:hypothetical protein